VAPAETEEAALQLGARDRRLGPAHRERAPEPPRSGPPPPAALQQLEQRMQVEQLDDLRPLERPLEPAPVDDAGELEQGQGNARARDALDGLDLVGTPHPVHHDPPVAPPGPRRRRDVDRRALIRRQVPERRGRSVRQERPLPAGEHGGHEPPMTRKQRVTDGVHAPVHLVQPPPLGT
jgi:hypothetical protein